VSATALPRSTEPASAGRARAAEGLAWLALVAAASWLFVALRGHLEAAHAALGYLLLVLGGSSRLGRSWGIALAIVCFLAFNFLLVPPYYTLAVGDPRHWLFLLAFLVTGVVAAQLLSRAQNQAADARARAEEIDHLSMLGAEALNAGRADEGVAAIARVLLDRLGLTRCDIFQQPGEAGGGGGAVWIAGAPAGGSPGGGEPLLASAVARGALALEDAGGRVRLVPLPEHLADAFDGLGEARVMVVPLRVRSHVVGLLRLAADRPLRLDAPARRFAEALGYYAALGVERVRLAAQAERGEALRASERLKDALLASVSHDLRTPLTTIKALAHEMAGDGDARAVVVEEETDRLNRFVSNLLDLSRLNGGAITVAAELVPAEELLGAALEQVAGAQGGVEIRTALPADDLLLGRFDLVLALRSLVNLLENACKYSGDAPVDLDVQRQGERLLFEVSDRGPGVPESESERIFEQFYRGPAGPATPGTGLGLTIARRLARVQGGDVAVAARPGGGSTFTLSLPAADLELPTGAA